MNRAVKVAAVTVLALAPTTYLVVAAGQSLSGSEGKERIAAATEPLHGRPPAVMQNIYDVRLPKKTKHNRYFETNSWQTSSMYLRFDTSRRGLDQFLKRIGTRRADLVKGSIPITHAQEKTFGWTFHGTWAKKQKLSGIHLPAREEGRPEHRVVVNLTKEKRPTVYVVSTVSY